MKRIVLLLFLFILLCSKAFSLSGQPNNQSTSFQFKSLINFFSYFANGLSSGDIDDDAYFLAPIDFELSYKINNDIALFVNPSVWISSSPQIQSYAFDINLAGGISYRPFGTALKGVFVSLNGIVGFSANTSNDLYLQYHRYTDKSTIHEDAAAESKYENQQYLNFGFMLETGHEWIFSSGFSFTVGAGISKVYPVKLGDYETMNRTPGAYLYGINLEGLPFNMNLRFSMGYSF